MFKERNVKPKSKQQTNCHRTYMPMIGKVFHYKENQRSLAGQPERFQIQPECLVDRQPSKVERFHKHFQYFALDVLLLADILTDHLLIQSGVFPQEVGNLQWIQRATQYAILLQEKDTFLRPLIEQIRPLGEQSFLLFDGDQFLVAQGRTVGGRFLADNLPEAIFVVTRLQVLVDGLHGYVAGVGVWVGRGGKGTKMDLR